MIANSIVIEQVFGIPGLGRTLISSISKRDYPVVEAVIVLIAVVILVVNADCGSAVPETGQTD